MPTAAIASYLRPFETGHIIRFTIRFTIRNMYLFPCGVGVINSKKFCPIKCFLTDFTPKATDLPSNFCLASIWSCKAASKSEAPKSTLIYKSCSGQKVLADLLLKLLILV